MFGTEHHLTPLEDSAIQRLCLVQLTLLLEKAGQVVDTRERIGVLRPQDRFQALSSSLLKLLCLVDLALCLKQASTAAHASKSVRVPHAKSSLKTLQHSLG